MCEYCLKCGVCCRLIPVDKEEKLLLHDGIQPIDDTFFFGLNLITIEEAKSINENYVLKVQEIFPDAKFYSCKYLTEENICSCSPKPEICEKYPSYGLAFLPDECGYEGKIFLEQEKLKQKVRKIKEEIIDYETKIEAKDADTVGYKKIIAVLEKSISKYMPYGAQDW